MTRKTWMLIAWALAAGLTAHATLAGAAPETPRDRALRLYKRVTGVPIFPRDPRVEQMTNMIAAGQTAEAVGIALEDPNFYSITLRNFAAVMSSKDESPLTPFNDFQAMVIGVTRDNLDARTLLSGNFTYRANSSGLPAPAPQNNDHYAAVETRNLDLKAVLVRAEPQWPNFPDAAGVLTSRAWGEAHLIMGTNRRGIEYAFREFLCAPKEQFKDLGVPDFYIRRDVSRAPGDNPIQFQQHCRSCHGILDGFGGVFAQYDFRDGRLFFLGEGRIAPKINQHANVYPDGFVVTDDQWVNFATRNHNAAFGWRGPVNGRGAREFGRMIAESEGFSRCMSQRVFKEICRREPSEADAAGIRERAMAFEAAGYKFKRLFQDTAADPACVEAGEALVQ